MARSRLVELALEPYVSALYATPRLALIPVLILWLGITFQMRFAVVVMSGVFPIILNTYLGGKEVDRNLLDAGRAFDAGRLQMLRTIVSRARCRTSSPGSGSGWRARSSASSSPRSRRRCSGSAT